jgi:hypothetical protein
MIETARRGMARSRVPFAAKLRPDMRAEVVEDRRGRGRLLLPTPMLVARTIAEVGPGRLITVSGLRSRMAAQHCADLACPLMTGIFFNLLAGAAEEQLAAGEPPVAPYWRVVRDDGTLSPKTPDGPDRHAEHLRAEGHSLHVHAGKLHVAGFQQRLDT